MHVEGTERIAEAVAKYDVDRYIHVSSFNADKKSPSQFYATKVRTVIQLVLRRLKAEVGDRHKVRRLRAPYSQRQR